MTVLDGSRIRHTVANAAPDHVHFVQERWVPEVAVANAAHSLRESAGFPDFLELDYAPRAGRVAGCSR